ncbi:MAG: hypothetical protein HC904_01815, partial [Blastochloris sp.]|nr:hypothetical protein [Blastochloris sp.]
MTYHYYTLSALSSLVMTAQESGWKVHEVPKFKKMFQAPLGLVQRDGYFPAHNDSWPGVDLLGMSGHYEWAHRLWPKEGFERELSWIYGLRSKKRGGQLWTLTVDLIGMADSGHARASTQALLHGVESVADGGAPRPGSRIFRESGIGILENEEVRVCLRFGPYGKSHEHHDKLNVDVWTRAGWKAADLGTSGYGAKITNAWYRTPAAHNIVVVDEKVQEGVDGRLLDFDESRVRADAP